MNQAKRGSWKSKRMQKRTIICIVKFAKRKQYKKEVPYMKNITNLPTMKELEQITFRALQNSFSKVMAKTLSELDQWIAENNGRSWCEMGLDQFLGVFVALKDNLTIRTLKGVIEPLRTTQDRKALKRTTQKVTKRAEEATRQNIPYLNGVVGKPITAALKGLVDF